MTNEKLLEEYIKNSGLKKSSIALRLGITLSSLRNKCTNKTEFKQSEIALLSELLEIPIEDRELVFLTINGD